MLSKLQLIFIVFLLSSFDTYSQEELQRQTGYFIDCNSKLINGFIDSDYRSEPPLGFIANVEKNFIPAHYYDLEGKRIDGYIRKYDMETSFEYIRDGISPVSLLDADLCSAYVVGTDSFTVISNFDYEGDFSMAHSDKREFAQVIERFDGLTFYRHIRSGRNYVTSYLLKTDTSEKFITFPTGHNKFNSLSKKIFHESQMILKGIDEAKYNAVDIASMAKILKFTLKFNRHEKTWYNSSWNETENDDNKCWYSEVISINDSVITIKYFFRDGVPYSLGQFSSFQPMIRNGNFEWYNKDGTIRKKASYLNDKLLSKSVCFPNGKTHYEYSTKSDKLIYSYVGSEEGKNKLDENGNGEDVFYDIIMKRKIFREFRKNQLFKSYFDDDNGRIYQLCENNSELYRSKLNKDYVNPKRYPNSSILNDKQGIVLIRCIVENNGLVSKVEIIKGVDPACDSLVNHIFTAAMDKTYFKPASEGKTQVRSEVVVPIMFSIPGYTIKSNDVFVLPVWGWNNMNSPSIPRNSFPFK